MESTVFTHTIATVYNSSILKLEGIPTPQLIITKRLLDDALAQQQ